MKHTRYSDLSISFNETYAVFTGCCSVSRALDMSSQVMANETLPKWFPQPVTGSLASLLPPQTWLQCYTSNDKDQLSPDPLFHDSTTLPQPGPTLSLRSPLPHVTVACLSSSVSSRPGCSDKLIIASTASCSRCIISAALIRAARAPACSSMT
jgi:hypothetical protein